MNRKTNQNTKPEAPKTEKKKDTTRTITENTEKRYGAKTKEQNTKTVEFITNQTRQKMAFGERRSRESPCFLIVFK